LIMQLPFKKNIDSLIIFFLAETVFILITARVLNFYHRAITISDLLITVIAITNFIAGFLVIKWLVTTKVLTSEVASQRQHLEAVEEALMLMRSERHDFINHLQSIHGLMLVGDHTEAFDYLKDLGADYRFNSQVMGIANPTLRILVQNKKNNAAAKNIDIKLIIKSKLKSLSIKHDDITKIFGNLFDNAIDALCILKEDKQKNIKLIITETDHFYHFFVQDSGLPVHEEVMKNMFKKGFSTKGQNRGYGLDLVWQTVKKYNGTIVYENDPKGFCLSFPKSEEAL